MIVSLITGSILTIANVSMSLKPGRDEITAGAHPRTKKMKINNICFKR